MKYILSKMKTDIVILKISCLCFSLSVCASCSNKVNDGSIIYPESFNVFVSRLKASEVSESEDLYGTFGLFFVGEDRVLLRYINDYYFGVWDLDDARIVRRFLRKGRGPGEFPSVSTPHVRIGEDGTILLDILTNSSIITVDYEAMLQGYKDYIVDAIDRKALLSDGRAYSSYILGDNVLSRVEGDQDILSFKLINRRDETVLKTFPVANLFDEDLPNVRFSNDDLLKPDNSKLALLMYEFNKILIFDIASGDHICIEVRREEDAVYHYGTCSNKYIYAMYGRSKGHKEVQVFDWDGKFVKVIDTDCDLMDIAVNEDDSYLYALTEDNKLLTFNLK